jgi:hypothetical protein
LGSCRLTAFRLFLSTSMTAGGRRAATRGRRRARQGWLIGRDLRPLPFNDLPAFLVNDDWRRRRR